MSAKANEFMEEALKEAYEGIDNNDGGPFGSVIVKNGEIVGRGHNRVLKNADPTCHGEMEAIRDACRKLGTHDLSGCELYTTAEPCPMCLGGILWANIGKVYYGCTIEDTDKIGFRDDRFYKYFNGEKDILSLEEQGHADCRHLFRDYVKMKRERY
ncbi:MAG: nucleoside deaminase [Eubacteriales bacterium]|nr:nucleoside deaminase [Eubacteriales bacterium]